MPGDKVIKTRGLILCITIELVIAVGALLHAIKLRQHARDHALI